MAFLLETFRGFIALIGIPCAIALFLEIRRIGGLRWRNERSTHPSHSAPLRYAIKSGYTADYLF